KDIPEWLQGDPHRLTQVLINLVGNAIKFTDKGTIRLRAALENSSAGASTVAFIVEDEGIGISPKHLPHIFTSFSQAGPDIARKYGGTGLGLAICDRLLSLQGGSIEVSSTQGKGTTFCFRLPFGSHPAAGQASGQEPSIGNYEGFLRELNVLVVEDNLINQKVTDHVLRKAGASVSLADNGAEAIRLLESDTFDLIIMDLHMPVMDGYETTRHLREVLQLRTPVLAMTASAINGEQVRCLEAGMNDYMSKPFEFREFYHRVARLISRPAGAPRPSAAKSAEVCFDLSLLHRVGDENYVQGILQTFTTTLPDQLAALQAAARSADFGRIQFIAHRLKGSAGMLQAAKLSDRLGRIEHLAGTKSEAGGLVEEVTTLLEELLGHLKGLVSSPGR
ncbi:MAG TPA: ATP-binding protein, partial [Puia sp.]|nr:ATP-binding protein [Puia sp.]